MIVVSCAPPLRVPSAFDGANDQTDIEQPELEHPCIERAAGKTHCCDHDE